MGDSRINPFKIHSTDFFIQKKGGGCVAEGRAASLLRIILTMKCVQGPSGAVMLPHNPIHSYFTAPFLPA